MDHLTFVHARAAVLATELERLRGIGIPLEFAAALLVKCLAAEGPGIAPRSPPGERPERAAAALWATAGCADEG